MNNDALYDALTSRPFVIAGPCVLESFELALHTARVVKEAAASAGLTAIFKSSYDKANRTSPSGFRGPGMEKGLEWLSRIRDEAGLPFVTDIHSPEQAEIVGKAADMVQIPAFLCRQTDLLLAGARTNKIVNVKKGQFLAPQDMRYAADKVFSTGNKKLLLTERGSSFGYNNLVVDMRAFPIMREIGVPLVMDATHAVQLPGGQGNCSGGDRAFVPALAKAAVAAGAQGVFLECHPDPDNALCDGPNSWPLESLPAFLRELAALWELSYAR
ncbi:2-dehydro-3-deoxyphosphooctonate aldolase [Deltaproteobacteria bacterium]|nr:2-dehydro-3-deoxyphosphooctonate aldolase [Deltaproteobacteria bacterium]